MDLKDKVVVITGSSSGIGQTTAIRFAREGAKIVLNYHTNKKGGEETLQEIKKITPDVILVQADVTKAGDIDKLFNNALGKFGSIDILINNAASPMEKVPFFEASENDLLDLINTNVVSLMICSKLVVPIMRKQGSGKIINTSSVKGWEHGGRTITYAVSKAAVNSFTRTLAKHVSPTIQVNAVAPGYVKTRIYDNIPEKKINEWLDETYLKRWVTQEEVADAFIFLAKNDAMTGQIIYVDAGYTLK